MLMAASPGRGGDGAGADRAQPATGSSTTDRKICSTDSGALSALLSAAAAAARKDQRNLAAFTAFAALTRAREAAPIPASSDADRPAPAGSAALRLLADVDSSFAELLFGRFGGGRWRSGSAPMLMAASPGRGGDGAGADRAQPATGSSTTDRKICSTDSGALSRARSALRPLRLGKISGIWQRLPLLLPSRARAKGRPIPASSDADRPAPAGSAALRLLADVDSSF